MRKVIDEATSYLCKDTLGLDLEAGKSLARDFMELAYQSIRARASIIFTYFLKKIL